MTVEVAFHNRRTGTDRTITLKCPSVADALGSARVTLYSELQDKRTFLDWGVVSVRKIAP